MGLILKDAESTKKEKNNFSANYKARYVELAKPMAGSIALLIYYLLGIINDDPDFNLKLSNIIATFICWLLGEEIIHRFCLKYNLYTKPNSQNPLYRNLKTLSSLGSTLGIIFASLSSSLSNRKLSISMYSMLMGSVIALSAFVIQQCISDEYSFLNDARLGTEGWSKYSKTALVLGASLGQMLGGVMSYRHNYDVMTSMRHITLYSAIASTACFFVAVTCIPLINYLTRNKNEKSSKGIFVCSDRNIFNNNYIRSGITLGVALGTVLGGLLGPALITGLSMEVAIAISSGTFSLILGTLLGIYGQNMTVYFEKYWGVSRDTENSWSYAARSTSYYFSYFGIAAAYVFCPGAALIHATIIGSAMTSLIGWFAGLFIIWLARKIEPDETLLYASTLPWTQRISSGATKGAIIGALVSLTVLYFTSGTIGLIECCTFYSALGGIIGGIKNTISDPAFSILTQKATSLFSDAIDQPKHRRNSPSNRYSFFSCESNVLYDYQASAPICTI